MPGKKLPKAEQPVGPAKPEFFFSYSMAEPTRVILSTYIWIVFNDVFTMRFTPSALTSGQSQLNDIETQITQSAFAVVCLDGLRPNVVHEYGYMRGIDKPVILLKRENATVDVRLFLRTTAPELENPSLVLDTHLSNLKDINYATWYPDDPPKSTKVIWAEYQKMKQHYPNANLPDVKEPQLW